MEKLPNIDVQQLNLGGIEEQPIVDNLMEETQLPSRFHIVTYDMRGTIIDTGVEKKTRQTGIVTQTHQLMRGFAEMRTGLHLSVTQTGSEDVSSYYLLTPEGLVVYAQGIVSGFPEYLRNPETGGKDKTLVKRYYEDKIHDPENPVYKSLAEQYTHVIRNANTPNILLQNPNPIVGLLKAEELGYLDAITLGQLNVTGVIHDVDEYVERLGYIRDRAENTGMNLKLIAVSQFVRQKLEDIGIPREKIFKVSNGMDIVKFDKGMEEARESHAFNEVRKRNNLPEEGKMILVPARRVEHKGHLDVIQAVKMLKDHGKFNDAYVAFTGNSMLNTQSLHFEKSIREEIENNGLEDTIFLLDSLSEEEVYACYDGANISVLASTEPEGFAYANVEAMLAGVPVITTRLGGPLDYIEHGKTGLFVDRHNPYSIYEQLDLLLHNQPLYETLSVEGRKKAEEFTIQHMAKGYAEAITSGTQSLPIRINPGKEFTKIGEGMYTEVYTHTRGTDQYVTQLFKRDKSDLTIEGVQNEYAYLREAYAAMPDLIPNQRLLIPNTAESIGDTALVKRKVDSNPDKNNLRKLTPEDLESKTLEQLREFVDITKGLLNYSPHNPSLQHLDSRVPDIIDPDFNNLVIDTNGNLKLVDTNRLIGTAYLKKLLETNATLDIVNKKIHTLFFRRLMYIESKFFGKTREDIQNDPFYNQYIAREDFAGIFSQSGLVDEHIL